MKFTPLSTSGFGQIEKEESKEVEEEEVDIVGIQEDEDSFAFGASETAAGNVTEAKDGVVVTLPPASVQKDTLTCVTIVLGNVLDAVCKMVQCNSDETMAGKILLLYKWLLSSLSLNYRGSFICNIQS